MSQDDAKSFNALRNFLSCNHAFTLEGFDPSVETFNYLHNKCRVLVVGAGGLGCEIIKGLALTGFSKISVIDMDTIEISNLNRQFLFREGDIGKPKAIVAAKAINERFNHLNVYVEAFVGRIQEKPQHFFNQFNIIIGGLDNIEARRWLNSMIHDMVHRDQGTEDVDVATVMPFLDGGTEGFKGQARIILPSMTSCFECSLDMFPQKQNYALCTIAETPRLPEHCIEYAYIVEWEKAHPGKQPELDDPDVIQWIYETGLQRAKRFNITGVTRALTLGVVKRIVPAIASTNALIAAELVNELSTYCGPILNTYWMFMGDEGVYSYTFEYKKAEGCLVCGKRECTIKISASSTLQELLDRLLEMPQFQLKSPSLTTSTCIMFMQKPLELRKYHEYKLPMKLHELVQESVFKEDEPITVTDPNLTSPLNLYIKFSNN